MRFCVLVVLLCAWQGTSSLTSNSTFPVRISPVIFPREGEGVCPANSTIQAYINVAQQEIRQVIDEFSHSCQGSGWKRVTFLNMAQTDQNCPSALTFISSPVRGCGRTQTGRNVCDSVMFPIRGSSYSKVCGRVQAFQRGYTDAFLSSIEPPRNTIESSYVDGISLTYGPAGSRHHIWTFAAARSETIGNVNLNCACSDTQINWPYAVPSFIGNNYFCDSTSSTYIREYTYFPNDPLWDGEGCGPRSTCCQLNNPPWFQTTLPHSTTEDIELRLCNNGDDYNSDVILYFADIYVK